MIYILIWVLPCSCIVEGGALKTDQLKHSTDSQRHFYKQPLSSKLQCNVQSEVSLVPRPHPLKTTLKYPDSGALDGHLHFHLVPKPARQGLRTKEYCGSSEWPNKEATCHMRQDKHGG